MSDEIKWRKDRHDDNVSAKEQIEINRQIGETLTMISKAFTQRKMSLQSKKKASYGDLKKFAEGLELMVQKHCNHPGAEDWKRTTLQLIREKIEILRLSEDGRKNVLTPFAQPPPPKDSAELPSALMPIAVRYSFVERGEFEMLEPVRQVALMDGFIGFVLDGSIVHGVFDGGPTLPVGQVLTGHGLEKYPSLKQFRQAMEENRKNPPKKKGRK